MRITNSLTTRNAIAAMQQALRQVDDAQRRATTGKRVERASDDPGAASNIMTASSSLRAIDQYQRNIGSAVARNSAEGQGLSTVTLLLERAKELGVGQASGTADATTRLVTKFEVDELLRQAIQTGNQRHEGEFLFGGDEGAMPLDLAGPPFSTTPPTGNRRTEISSGFLLPANRNATDVFLATGVLAALNELSVALGANDQAAITQSLYSLDAAHSGLQVLVGENGARANQLDVTASNLSALDTSLRTYRSNLEDVDLEAAVTELVARQTAYQTAMLATSRIIGLNLTDYI
ncbi:MAG: flagellin N-terminal helical domain-containing protein [Gemmatimonadota bacterium]